MDINFKPLEAEDMARLEPYFQLRSNLTCDSVSWRASYGKNTIRRSRGS